MISNANIKALNMHKYQQQLTQLLLIFVIFAVKYTFIHYEQTLYIWLFG